MKFLLDTNSCVVLLRRGDSSAVAAKLKMAPPQDVALCSIVVAELFYGAYRSTSPQTLAQVTEFCAQFASLPFDDPAAAEYGRIRANLSALGTPIGPNDLMIAAIALSRGLTLVTHNTREFGRVSGLRLEDWQA